MLCWLCGSSPQAGGRREALARREVIPEEGFASWSDPSPPWCRFRAMAPTQTPLRLRLTSASAVPHRALLGFSCKLASLCRALPVFSCRLPCTSLDSLQGLNFVQGKRGSARQIGLRARFSACTSAVLLQAAVHFARFLARVRADAGIRGKCTASCKKSGEMHARPSSSWGSWRISPHAHSVKAETRGVLPRLRGKSSAYGAALSAL